MVDKSKKPVAVITGASGGLGRAMALKLAEDGFAVVVNYHKNKKGAEKVVKNIINNGGRGFACQADVSKSKEVELMIEKTMSVYGHVDVMVNNAGIRKDQLLIMMEEKDWDEVVNVNLKSVFICCKYAAFEMMKRKQGKIINISSVSALMGTPGQVNYVAAKGGIISMTKTMARELAQFNVLVNTVAPGFIDTEMLEGGNDLSEYLKLIPQKRLGKTEEVANLISFIASNKLSYTTGHVFYVDGGLAI